MSILVVRIVVMVIVLSPFVDWNLYCKNYYRNHFFSTRSGDIGHGNRCHENRFERNGSQMVTNGIFVTGNRWCEKRCYRIVIMIIVFRGFWS